MTIEAQVQHGAILLRLDQVPEATAVLEAAHELAIGRAADNPVLLRTARLWLAEARFADGDLAASDALVTAIRESLTENDSRWTYRSQFEDLSHRLSTYGQN